MKYDQLYFLSNQIERFFDHKDLWKELINILDLLHGDSNLGEVTFEAATFGWVDSLINIFGSNQSIS